MPILLMFDTNIVTTITNKFDPVDSILQTKSDNSIPETMTMSNNSIPTITTKSDNSILPTLAKSRQYDDSND